MLNVSQYAIDSLRQLAKKFLEKEELNNFNFQKAFLKPFHIIIAKNGVTRDQIREFIVTCMWSLVMEKTQNMKSGWTIILTIFKIAAQDKKELADIAITAMDKVIKNDFSHI